MICYNHPMQSADYPNVLGVFMTKRKPGRDLLAGVLEEMSVTNRWYLDVIRSGRSFTERSLVDDDGRPYDGIILSEPGTDGAMEQIAASRTPTVLVNIADPRISKRGKGIATVWLDNGDIGRLAAQHLLSHGEFKSAGYVHELRSDFYKPESAFYSEERLWAFRETMAASGIGTSAFPEDNDFHDFSERLRKWVRSLPKPAAVMAVSDRRAADVINACRAEGFAVPEQVAVIGVDNDISRHAECGMSISSVIIDLRRAGRMAICELDFLLRHPKWRGRVREVLVPAKEVFCGESTARSPIAARLAAAALDFISANKLRKLSPDDVATHLGCSRRLAELRLAEVCGKTLHQAIEEARMAEVRRRLREGESVSAIVREMDFPSPKQLYRVFRRHFGHPIRLLHASPLLQSDFRTVF